METFIVIDGNSLINRAFYALPPLNGKDGKPTNAVYGFVNMLIKLMDYKPDCLAVAFDLKAPTFRHKEYALYKANRKGMPDDLAVQLPILKDLLCEMGITVVEKEGYEADDIIGTMARRYDGPTYIVTGDRDSFQLIDDTTKVIMTKKGMTDTVVFDRTELKAQYDLTPEEVIVYKALAGDQSDNIPGVPGIGEKTATELVKRFHTLDDLYVNIEEVHGKMKDKLIAGKDSAYMSLELATIYTEVPDLPKAEQCRMKFPFGENVKARFDELNFRSLLRREEIFSGEIGTIKVLPECEIVSLDRLTEMTKNVSSACVIIERSGIFFEIDNKGYKLPLKETLLDDGEDEMTAVVALKPFLEGDAQKIVFDAKTLKKRLSPFGVSLVNFFDVELCQYLVDPSVDHRSLSKLSEEYALSGGAPLVLRELYVILKEKMRALGMEDLYYKLELPLVDVLFDMEQTGFKVDVGMLNELDSKYEAQIKALHDEIIAMAGHDFNINSPKQLGVVLFEEFKIPYPKRSKNYSTGAEILEPLRGNFPIVDKVLGYRFLFKLKSTYLDGLKIMLDKDDVVHTEFKQMLTATGRLSSVEPNLQNIPIRTPEGRNLRNLFVAREGNILVSADYSQIELRLMAHLSGDPRMVEAYLSGEDIHASTASEIYGVPIGEVTPEQRREAKIVNFGIIYGMSDFGLSQSLGISPRQAGQYIRKYFERFGGVKKYLDDTVEFARKNGYVETLYGRRRYIPELKSSNFMQRSFGERVAMNTPLQGSAADIIKAAMIDVSKRLMGMRSKLILQIHDELIIDADVREEEEVKSILIDCMENVAKLRVPLKVEVGCGKRWFDCK